MMLLAVQAEDRMVRSHGLDIHYRMIGQGKPLLILGGGPGDNADRYLSLCDLLSKNTLCILVEQRGTGKSTPPACDATTIHVGLTLDDFEAIRQQTGLKEWSVLGFSYGGWLASLYAHEYPQSISKLVLLGSMGLNWDGLESFEDNITSRLHPEDLEKVAYWSDKNRLKANRQHAITEIVRAKMPAYFYSRQKSLEISETICDSDFNFSMGRFIYEDAVKRKLDLTQMGNPFSHPVLIVHGRQDPGGDGVAYILRDYYAKSQMVFIEKAGHYAWIEQPEKVLSAIETFMAAMD